MVIIRERTREVIVEHRIEFDNTAHPGCGFTFEADESWNPVFNNEYARRNYESCLLDKDHFDGPYNRTREYHVTKPAVGRCDCGCEVPLTNQYMGACQCDRCGQWYNMFGQELLDPTCWEREVDY